MKGLPVDLLSLACRIFLEFAYPGGKESVPESKRVFMEIDGEDDAEKALSPPVCFPVPHPEGGYRGYAWRLGSSRYPHLKIQMIDCDDKGTWVFGVDTHDTIRIDPSHPDAPILAELQAANKRLKEEVEGAWERAGLLTFNALLRRNLEPDQPPASRPS